MALVQFYDVTPEQFKNLTTKDESALYFLSNGQLYKGGQLIGNNIELITDSFPSTGVKGILYIKPSTGESKYWDGTQFLDFTKEITTLINAASTDEEIPTAAAVRTYASSVATDKANAAQSNAETNANKYTDSVKTALQALINKKAPSADGVSADSALKLTTSAGDVNKPVYFKNGVPVGINYTINKTVPSDAKFTDTTYENATQSAAGLMSAEDKKRLDGLTPGDKNQNAFSKVAVGSSTIEAETTTDTLTIVAGTNVTLTPDVSTDKITIAAKDTTYTKGAGINISDTNVISNAGVRSISSGSVNGTISVNTDGTVANVAVKGLGSAAYATKGGADGVAELDANGKVLTSQLPSYVDDVVEYSGLANFPTTGTTGIIYVDTATNKTYRWSGTKYVEISASLTLGNTSSTAFRGDYGHTLYSNLNVSKGSDTKPIYLKDGVPTEVASEYVTLDTAQTITGNKIFTGVFDFSNTTGKLSSHYYHRLYSDNNVYVHYYDTTDFSKTTTATFRVSDATNKTFKALQFSGDGNFKWDNSQVLTEHNYGSYIRTLPYLATTQVFSPVAGRDVNLTAGTSRLYANALVISNPTTADDVGWVRVTGTGESDTVLEIATGDDGGGSTCESIVARQYNTSNGVARQAVLLASDGASYFPVSVSAPVFIGSLSGNASSSTTASVAAKLGQGGATSTAMTFNWSGQSGQPTWLWGGSNGTDMYVYNPSNFNVATAITSTALTVNNTESKDVGRLQFLQTSGNSTLMPDTDWWSLVRTQHAGYPNGYWQEMAYSFHSDTIKFRRNVNGTLNAWVTLLHSGNYSSYALPRSAGLSYPLTGELSFKTNLWAGNIIAHNASSQKRWEIYSNSNSGAVAATVLRVYNATDGSAYVNYTFGTDGTLTATKFSGTLSGTASSANWLNINSALTYGASGLQYFNLNGTEGTTANANVTPTSAYYHILRMNHGNSSGYFADIAVPLNDTAGVWWRQVRGGTNYGWFKLLDSNNYTTYTDNRYVYDKAYCSGTMNDAATWRNAMGMINVSAPSSGTASYVNPNGQIGWHHFINISYPTESGNMWQTQIANKAGTTDLWVRSRGGGTVANDTAWVAPWTRILTGSNYTNVTDGRYVKKSGDTGITGVLRSNSEIQTTSLNAFRMVCGNYGVFLRNDGDNTYFLITNSGDQYGNWNSLRPFYFSNSTGLCTINGTLNGHASSDLSLSGGTMTGALNFANGTWNTMGDDAYIGDCNQAGCIGIKGKNGATGIYFANYSGGTDQKISINGAGTMTITGTVASTFSGSLNGNAATATTAAKLGRNGDVSIPMTFNWSGQSGQPTWLWGGDNGTDMYVYNPSNFSVNYATYAAYLSSRGAKNPQTGRTQAYGNVYSYNTNASAYTGAPTTYTSVIGFGQGTAGTVEIAGEWTGGRGLWARALRDTIDDWYSWQQIYTSNYHPIADRWSTARTLTLTGSVTGSVSIDGSGNVTLATTTNNVASTGFGTDCFTYFQTSNSFAGSDASWAGYLISNHGAGATYFNQILRMPFWSTAPQYSYMSNGTQSEWYTLHSTGNSSKSATYSSGLSIGNVKMADSTSTYYVPYATSSQAGVVSTAAQTFAGVKTFNNGLASNGNISLANGTYIMGKNSAEKECRILTITSSGNIGMNTGFIGNLNLYGYAEQEFEPGFSDGPVAYAVNLYMHNAATASNVNLFSVGGNTTYGNTTVAMSNNYYYSVVRSLGIYNRTTTSAANVFISSTGGVLMRSTSASKYKLNIKKIEQPDSYYYNTLKLSPKQWNDKGSVEAYANYLTRSINNDKIKEDEEEKDFLNNVDITPVYGLVAEDVEKAGLEKYCVYAYDEETQKNEIEGIQYDRLWIPLIPVIRDIVLSMQKILPVIIPSIRDEETLAEVLKLLNKFNSFNEADVID